MLVNTLYSRIDKATKKNVFHLNKSARQKSRILNFYVLFYLRHRQEMEEMRDE